MTEYAIYRDVNPEAVYLIESDDVVVRDGCLVFVDKVQNAAGFRAKVILAAGTWRTVGIKKPDQDEIEPPHLTAEEIRALES